MKNDQIEDSSLCLKCLIRRNFTHQQFNKKLTQVVNDKMDERFQADSLAGSWYFSKIVILFRYYLSGVSMRLI